MDCCEFLLAATGAADSSPLWVDIVAWLFIIVFGFFIVAMVVLLTLMWIGIELEWLCDSVRALVELFRAGRLSRELKRMRRDMR